jgi:hypothetical protein
MSDIKQVNGMFQTVINGKTVRRTKMSSLQYAIRKAGGTTGSTEQVEVKESRFSINERFGFLSDMVTMLARGDQASVVVTGPGGLGKSHTVTSALVKTGFTDTSTLEEGSVVNKEKAFNVIKGYSTPKGLYRTLYENRDGVVVFDDCDSVLKDPVSVNLLKAALDSYDRRIISWRADFRDEELPNSFEFKGRVVFISNMDSGKLDQAIVTRSLAVDLSMTNKQKVERMQHLCKSKDFMSEYAQNLKDDAMALIESLQDEVKELSLRTLIQVTKIRKSAGENWKELAEYAICG